MNQTIKGCRKRRRESQKALYEMFYAYGMSIALRYADTREQGAAILNDAFMKVFDNIKKYDPQRPFKPWLRRIIINTAIDHFHREQKQASWIDQDYNEAQLIDDEKIISGITYQEIIEMLQELPPAYRTVFNLYVIEGFTHEEIAGTLGISTGTSKSNLAKAKKKLRSILEKNLT